MSALLSNQIGENKCNCCIKLFDNPDFCYIISIRLRHKHLNKSLYIAFQTYAKYTFRFSTTNEGDVKTTTTTTTYRHRTNGALLAAEKYFRKTATWLMHLRQGDGLFRYLWAAWRPQRLFGLEEISQASGETTSCRLQCSVKYFLGNRRNSTDAEGQILRIKPIWNKG